MGWKVKNVFNALLFTLFVIAIEADQQLKVRPSHYKIHIETTKDHFEKEESSPLTYAGEVTITLKKEPKDFNEAFKIVLDTNPKTTVKGKVELKEKVAVNPKTFECKHELNKNKLELSCPKGTAGIEEFELTVKYENPFGDDMTGFYRSSYTDSSNKTSWLLTTHFEPVYARNAFPCFDRPDWKAKFTVSIKVPSTVSTVLSNTERDDGEPKVDGEFKIYKFKETNIPMSTYLVAFTVAAKFDSTDELEFSSPYNGETATKKYLRTYGRPDIIKEDGKFAQVAGKAALEGLTKYLGQGYALNKVDQVGIPDFSAGAMENFGHISFREKSLYVNERSTTTTKQSNLLTVVHELVHQWFGNLVTLENWDYIWLNEAFANYLEYVIASEFKDEKLNTSDWNLMEQMVVNEIHSRAFETDGLTSSKPLTNKITDENLILPAFNDIPYAKGASVLRMWELSLGSTKFQESLREYIKARGENFANPKHLYEAFKNKASMSEKYFKTWTEQMGYPVVEVQRFGNDSYNLTQSPFTWEKSNGTQKWEIPITYLTDEKTEGKTVFLTAETPLQLKDVKGKWIVVNINQAGYYRVNYNTQNWEALSKALNESDHSKIPELNRAQIINDIFSLARSVQKDYVKYALAFDLAKYLEKETKYTPWKTALNSFDFVATKIRKNDKAFENFKSYFLKLIKPHFKKLGNSTGTAHVEKLKNAEIARWACSLDYEPCVKQAKDLYNSSDYNKYPDIRETVLCTVVRTDKTVWDDIYKKYKEEKDSSLRVMYLLALGCTTDSKKAKDYLESTLKDDSGIRKQDLMFVLQSVYNGNIKNLDTAFEFIERNFTDIAKKYGGINPLGRAVVGIARKLDTDSQCKRLEDLVKKIKSNNEVKGADESLDNALKVAKANCAWGKDKISQLHTYFSGASSFASSLSLLLLCLFFIFQF